MLLGFYLQQVKDRVLNMRSEHVADQCQSLAQLGTSWHVLASVCARFPGRCHWPLCQGARKASPHGFKTRLEQQPIATMVSFQTRGSPREPDCKGGPNSDSDETHVSGLPPTPWWRQALWTSRPQVLVCGSICPGFILGTHF